MLKNILCVRTDRFGEFLLTLPAIKALKDRYPGARISVMAQKANLSLVSNVDYIDECLDCDHVDAAFLREKAYDCAIVFNPVKMIHRLIFKAQISRRIGYNRKWPFCLNQRFFDIRKLDRVLEWRRNFVLTSFVGVEDGDFCVPLSTEEITGIENFDQDEKYIIFHPFTSDKRKEIDLEKWMVLAQRLTQRTGRKIILVGAPEEREMSESLARDIGALNLVGRISLPQLAGLFKDNTFLFVGLDSGPMHLASFFDVPLIGLFVDSDIKRWGPQGKRSIALWKHEIDYFIEEPEQFAGDLL